MIVLAKSFGNNSNILFQNLHLEAFCREHDVQFVNPFLQKYSTVFPDLMQSIHSEYSFSGGLLMLKSLFARNFDGSRSVEADRQWLLNQMDRRAWVKGWAFRSHEDVEKSKKYFQRLFTPICDSEVRRELEDAKRGGGVLSVHVRRGDYRYWQGGQYFYEDNTYVELIRRALNAAPGINKVMMFSNEFVNVSLYEGLGIEVIHPRGEWYEDQWRMAQSDFIIGPPSTFSLWASFIGDVPIWQVAAPDSPAMFESSRG